MTKNLAIGLIVLSISCFTSENYQNDNQPSRETLATPGMVQQLAAETAPSGMVQRLTTPNMNSGLLQTETKFSRIKFAQRPARITRPQTGKYQLDLGSKIQTFDWRRKWDFDQLDLSEIESAASELPFEEPAPTQTLSTKVERDFDNRIPVVFPPSVNGHQASWAKSAVSHGAVSQGATSQGTESSGTVSNLFESQNMYVSQSKVTDGWFWAAIVSLLLLPVVGWYLWKSLTADQEVVSDDGAIVLPMPISQTNRVEKLRPETEASFQIDSCFDDLTTVKGIDLEVQDALHAAGFVRYQDLNVDSRKQMKQALAKAECYRPDSAIENWIKRATKLAQQKQNANDSTLAFSDDDLTRIHGIGYATAKVLQAAGVSNFQDLRSASLNRLREVLSNAGERFKLVDPSSWAQQADVEIRRISAEPNHPGAIKARPLLYDGSETQLLDDLTEIRGIGPATQRILRKKGIKTFQQIACLSVEQLKSLFADCQQYRFKVIDPSTWPSQAQEACNRRDAEADDLTIERELLNEINSISETNMSFTPAAETVHAVHSRN